jgi:hypothetical protein
VRVLYGRHELQRASLPVIAWFLAAAVGSSLAAEPTYRLEYRREATAMACPDQASLQRSVAERLGRDPFSAKGDRTVAVKLSGAGGSLSVNIRLLDAKGTVGGQRELSSTNADCVELAKATALAVAIVIDPMVVTRPEPVAARAPPSPPPPSKPLSDPTRLPPELPDALSSRADERENESFAAPPPPPPAPAEVLSPPPPPPAPPPPPPALLSRPIPPGASSPAEPKSDWGLFIGVGAALSIADLPSPAPSAMADLFWEQGRWALGARVSFTTAGGAAVGEGRVDATLVDGGPLLCVRGRYFGGCLLGRFGALQSWASGFPNSRGATTPMIAAGVEPFVELPVGDVVRLRVRTGFQVHTGITLLQQGTTELWRTPLVSVALGASVSFRAFGDKLP